jgi:hypothetical protein
MARVTLTVQGKLPEISLDSLLLILRESHYILQELDRAVSQRRDGTLKWMVSGLKQGSVVVETESRVIRGQEDFGPQVARRFMEGIHTIQTEGVTPALFSPDSIASVNKIVRSLGTNGVSGLNLTGADRDAELTGSASNKIQALVGVRNKSIGSVEGRLELVSIHVRTRRFNIYHAITNKAIRCNLPKAMEKQVISNLGRMVIVSGVVSYNAVGEPVKVEVDRLRALKEEKELPTIAEMLGMARDITGALSTEEHIRQLRDG